MEITSPIGYKRGAGLSWAESDFSSRATSMGQAEGVWATTIAYGGGDRGGAAELANVLPTHCQHIFNTLLKHC